MKLQTAGGDPLPPVTISVGVAAIRSDDTMPDSIIERADKGLYEAKESGRNCVRCVDVRVLSDSPT
jgi:diguanylate cyclase (GGDEF)-like protein